MMAFVRDRAAMRCEQSLHGAARRRYARDAQPPWDSTPRPLAGVNRLLARLRGLEPGRWAALSMYFDAIA